MIKVGIDNSPLNNQNAFRGVGRYTKNLIEEIEKKQGIEVVIGKWKDIQENVDLIHFPYFDLFFHTLPIIKKKKTVVTIHDCIPLVFPECYPSGIKGKISFFLQKISLKTVDGVITDSESSKKDIVKFLDYPEEKIDVVYLAADPRYKNIKMEEKKKAEIRKKYGLNEKFGLYVNDVNYNKNLPGLIKAFNEVKDNLQLVLVGKAFENQNLPEIKNILGLIDTLKLNDKIKILGFVPDEDLIFLYNMTEVYCQPSFYEGFGLQILEAMACGSPVVTGNVSSMPEVSGDAGILVNPNDVRDIAEGINKVISNPAFRSKMIKLGFDQAKKFSWVKTAEETIKCYEKVLSK